MMRCDISLSLNGYLYPYESFLVRGGTRTTRERKGSSFVRSLTVLRPPFPPPLSPERFTPPEEILSPPPTPPPQNDIQKWGERGWDAEDGSMTTQVIVDGVALPLFQEEEKLNNDADDEKKKTNGLRRFPLFHSLWHALAIRHHHHWIMDDLESLSLRAKG